MFTSKFDKKFNLIMESFNTTYSELFNKIKNYPDPELLNDWVEAIEEQNIITDFDIDEMEHFDEMLNPVQLNEIINIGLELLQSKDNSDVVANELPDVVDEQIIKIKGYPVKFLQFADGKWNYQFNNVFDADPELDDEHGEGNWYTGDLDTNYLEDMGYWYPEVDDFNYDSFFDSLEQAKEDAEADISNKLLWNQLRPLNECKDNKSSKKIITEKHISFSKYFPVLTKDGEDTGWRMGPSDFSGKGKKGNRMTCSVDPTYEIPKDGVIMINPKFPGVHIAIATYYKALDGDKDLAEKLKDQYDIDLNLNV